MDDNATIARRQAAFDIMVRHLRQQGRPSADADGSCLYRGPDGTKCAVGALISDDTYSPDLEGLPATNLAIVAAAGLEIEDRTFLGDCQGFLHDDIVAFRNVIAFRRRLEQGARWAAETWGLKVPD